MSVRDLIPWGSKNTSAPSVYRTEQVSPFLALHREMNRLFDETLRSFNAPGIFRAVPSWPDIEISDAEKEIRVSAELPGMQEKDVEVLLEGDVLTIRGEKKSETEDKDRHLSERFYGRFERQIPLGYEVEPDKVNASFNSGVLTLTIPKSEKSAAKTKRIAIKAGS
jgi:HSP20 family protein